MSLQLCGVYTYSAVSSLKDLEMAWFGFWAKLLYRVLWGILKAVLLSVWFIPRTLFSSWKTPDLNADVCLVTGAGQGLGRQLALQLAECGATLVLWDIDGERVRAVAGEIREGGREAHPYVVDCSKKEDVYRVAARVRDEVGDVAVLVNNAGILHTKNYVSGESSDEDIQKSFSVNTLAHFWVRYKGGRGENDSNILFSYCSDRQ